MVLDQSVQMFQVGRFRQERHLAFIDLSHLLV